MIATNSAPASAVLARAGVRIRRKRGASKGIGWGAKAGLTAWTLAALALLGREGL